MTTQRPTHPRAPGCSPETPSALVGVDQPAKHATVDSADGTTIGYLTLGAGDGVIVVGGVLRSARDYLPLAHALAGSFEVHVMDRRGRGASGAQGPAYSLAKEREDLITVQAETGAKRVFGHSYGGLVALETARHADVFDQLAVYEPGVSINGSIPRGWMPRYRKLLAKSDRRGAFAAMVKQAGFAPRPLKLMPLWLVRSVLRFAIPSEEWQQTEQLLEANLAEHEQQARLDACPLTRYEPIASEVLLCGGDRSPRFISAQAIGALHDVIPRSQVAILKGVGHLAPEHDPRALAECVTRFFAGEAANGAPETAGAAAASAQTVDGEAP
jgi:pimeloyl-ACP methyl ester carboxylesterase